jgi:hypothetical protein
MYDFEGPFHKTLVHDLLPKDLTFKNVSVVEERQEVGAVSVAILHCST